MKKPILYFDMDNVLVDFQSGIDATPSEVFAQYADDGLTHTSSNTELVSTHQHLHRIWLLPILNVTE